MGMTNNTTATLEASKFYAAIAPSPFPLSTPLDCSPSPADFFWDTPWGNIAPERRGQITVIPVLPRGRLLGGSKLAALAAARKKKQEEQSRGSGVAQPTNTKADTDKAVALLDKLTVKNKDNTTPSTDTVAAEEHERKPVKSRLQYRKRQATPEPVVAEPEEELTIEEPTPSIQLPNLRIGPSSFASTLCGAGNSSTVWKSAKAQASDGLTEVLPKVIAGDPFAGPSPDDIVLRAQAKGKRAVHG
jgi:elongation factor 1 alpha-like protein